MSHNHLSLSASLKIMVLSSQTLLFVAKDNIYSLELKIKVHTKKSYSRCI